MRHILIKELQEHLEEFVATEPERSGAPEFWRKPVMASAPIDERFGILPRIAFDEHLHPHDLLETVRSVLVFFIPFKKDLVKENKIGNRPCRNWGLAYVHTNDLINRASESIGEFLQTKGYRSGLTPATHNFDEKRLMARWSHKHLAHLVGLGCFGTHYMLITPKGCSGRLGSLVTEAELGDNPALTAEEACLLKAGKECGKCIERCPVNALGETGFDRRKCWDRLKENLATLEYFSDLPDTTHVCGKCAAMMPCSFKSPIPSRVV